MARKKQNNEPEKKGVDPGRFFAVAGKADDKTNAEGKKGTPATRMAFAYDQKALDKRIDRKTRDLRDTVDIMRKLLLSISKDMRDLQNVTTNKNKAETKRAKEEKYALVSVKAALFDIRGTLAAFTGVRGLEKLQQGDTAGALGNFAEFAALMAPEIFNIATNVVTGSLIAYGFLRGRGARVNPQVARGASAAVPRAPSIPGGSGSLGKISLALKVLSLLGGGVLVGKALSGGDKTDEDRLAELLVRQNAQKGSSPLDLENVNRFTLILNRFESVVDNLLRTSKPKEVKQEDIDPDALKALGPKGSPYSDPSKVPNFKDDEEFLRKVNLMSKKLGIKPSQLLSLLSKESGINIDPKSKNKSGATGIFQLMFDPKNDQDRRFGYTREEFAGLSRAQQMDVYNEYIDQVQKEQNKQIQGTMDTALAQLAPALLGSSPKTPVYTKEDHPKAYEANKALDIEGAGKGETKPDGVITAGEIRRFMMQNQSKFESYDELLKKPVYQKGGGEQAFIPLDLSPPEAPAFNDPGPIASAASGENEIYSAENPHSHLRLNYVSTFNLVG